MPFSLIQVSGILAYHGASSAETPISTSEFETEPWRDPDVPMLQPVYQAARILLQEGQPMDRKAGPDRKVLEKGALNPAQKWT